MKWSLITLVSFLSFFFTPLRTEISLAPMASDRVVLQAEVTVPVWSWAAQGGDAAMRPGF